MTNDELPIAPIGEIPPKPGYDETLGAALVKPFYQAQGMVADIIPQVSYPEERRRIADKLDIINQKLSDPRLSGTQSALNSVAEWGASIASTLPLMAAGGGVAGGVADLAGVTGEALLPETTINFLRKPINKIVTSEAADYVPGASVGAIAKATTEAYGAYKGMIIPEHVVENFNKQNDTLNSDQALEDWSNDNWGFAVPAIPLIPGYLIFKALKVHGETRYKGDLAKAMVEQHTQVSQSRKDLVAAAMERATAAVDKEKQTTSQRQNAILKAQTEAGKSAAYQRLHSHLETEIDNALKDKRISPSEHSWMMQYLQNPNDQDALFKKGLPILSDAQIPIDRATGRLWYEIIDKTNMKNLKQALADRLGSDLPKEDQDNMTDYIAKNSFDASNSMIANNPSLMNALKGFTIFANEKLNARKRVTKAAKKLLQEHVFVENPDIFDQEKFPYLRLNEINKDKLDTMKRLYELKEKSYRFKNATQEYGNLLKNAREKYPDIEHELEYLKGNMLSQENIYKHLSEKGLPPKGAPYTIPDIVREKLAITKQMGKATEMSEMTRLGARLRELKFETIPKEIERLTNELERKLKHDYKQSNEYKRLQDLADTRDDAKHAIAYLDMIHEYNRQEALLRSMESFVTMADSTVEKFADPQKVINYLNKRMEQNVPEFKKAKEVKSIIEERQKPPKEEAPKPVAEAKTPEKTEIKLETEAIKESGAEDLAKEYDLDKRKYEQFAENTKVLDELVKCTIGKVGNA